MKTETFLFQERNEAYRADGARKETRMSIRIQETEGLFTLETAHTMYQMKADETGVLLHSGEKL